MNKPLTDDTVSRYRTFVNALDVAGYLAIAFLLFSRSCCPGACLISAAGLARSHGA